jgi:Zn-dependent peptidase ImmA (M78 family)
MAVRRKQIRETVSKLLAGLNIKTAPVPVEKIVKSLKISLSFEEVDDDVSGFLYRNKKANKIVIGANKSHHEHRQRFTIAHEIGHFLLHEGALVHLDSGHGAFRINLRDSASSTGEDNDEREANFFAAELLMPAAFLTRDLKGENLDLLEGDSEVLEKLAKKYKVSIQALTFRLANLGYISV